MTTNEKEIRSLDVSHKDLKEIIETGESWVKKSEGNDFIISPYPGSDKRDRKKLGEKIADMRSTRMHHGYSPRIKKK